MSLVLKISIFYILAKFYDGHKILSRLSQVFSLVNFNEYYIENFHSKIRAQTSKNFTAENIIKQAYVIGMHFNNLFI